MLSNRPDDTGSIFVRSAASGNITAPTLEVELVHRALTGDVNGTPGFAAFWTELAAEYGPGPDFIVGPAGIYGFFGGAAAVTGFISFAYLELPVSAVGAV